MSNVLDRLEQLLGETKKKEPAKTEIKLPSFDPLLSEIKKRFGKESIIKADHNGVILVVRITRESYVSNQKELEMQSKQEWIYDKGYSLVSIQGDTEPSSVKLYFCHNIQSK